MKKVKLLVVLSLIYLTASAQNYNTQSSRYSNHNRQVSTNISVCNGYNNQYYQPNYNYQNNSLEGAISSLVVTLINNNKRRNKRRRNNRNSYNNNSCRPNSNTTTIYVH